MLDAEDGRQEDQRKTWGDEVVRKDIKVAGVREGHVEDRGDGGGWFTAETPEGKNQKKQAATEFVFYWFDKASIPQGLEE